MFLGSGEEPPAVCGVTPSGSPCPTPWLSGINSQHCPLLFHDCSPLPLFSGFLWPTTRRNSRNCDVSSGSSQRRLLPGHPSVQSHHLHHVPLYFPWEEKERSLLERLLELHCKRKRLGTFIQLCTHFFIHLFFFISLSSGLSRRPGMVPAERSKGVWLRNCWWNDLTGSWGADGGQRKTEPGRQAALPSLRSLNLH